MKKRPVNLQNTDENIADQYPDIIDGLQKDSIQNAWDARLVKRGTDWKIIFKFDPFLNCLIIEDFGTTGMNEAKWAKYQGLWDTDKAENYTNAGSRGQGKFLFHYFSKDKIILTETIDQADIYRFSFGNTQEYDDETKKLSDLLRVRQKLDHQGTRIWITDIKSEFRQKLLDEENFVKLIISSWWEIIQNFDAKIVINFSGEDKLVTLPEIAIRLEKERHYQNEKIKDFGEVKNFVIRFYENNLPEHPFFEGISVQRAGMTVCKIPIMAEESLKKRIYGYINFDKYLEQELKQCELPNHMSFNPKRVWTHTKDFIDSRLESFILEVGPKKEKIIADQKVLDEAVRLINKLVYEYAPELADSEPALGGRPSGKSNSAISRPKSPVRVDTFSPNERKIEYGGTLITDCGVVNETKERRELSLAVDIRHVESEDKKFSAKYNFPAQESSRKTVDIPLLDFDRKIDKPGRYLAKATLKEDDEILDSKRFAFYVHVDPPKGKAFISKFIPALGKGQYFERWKNLPRNDKGLMYIIWDHPEFVRLRENSRLKSKKMEGREIMFYCTKCGASEAVRKLIEAKIGESNLNGDSLKEILRIQNDLVYAAHASIFI